MKRNHLAGIAALLLLVVGTAGIISARGVGTPNQPAVTTPAVQVAAPVQAQAADCDKEDDDDDRAEAKEHRTGGEENERAEMKSEKPDTDKIEHECGAKDDDDGEREDGGK